MIKLIKKNRDFRKFLMFSTFLGIGDTMFSMFMMWIVHYTYQNPVYTGIAGFMLAAPMILSFIAGPFVDRLRKPVVLRATTFMKMAVAAAVLASHFVYYPGVWLFFVVIFLFGTAQTFGSPAFSALMPKVIDGSDLPSANSALNVIGILAGLPFAAIMFLTMDSEGGFGRIYMIITGVLVLGLLSSFFLPNDKGGQTDKYATKMYFKELATGFSFAKSTVIFPLMVATISMSFFAEVAYANFPAFAEMHMGDASGYILLSVLALTGGLIGSILVGVVKDKFSLAKIFVGGFILMGLVRVGFVQLIQEHRTAGILTYVLYIGMATTVVILFNVVIQKLPPKNLVGGISTNTTSLSAVAGALGALAGGFLGNALGDVNLIFMLQGASYVLIGTCLLLSKKVRDLPKIKDLSEQ